MSKKVQINILVPENWKLELEKIARIQSYEQDKSLTYIDIIKNVLVEYISGSLKNG